MLSGEYSPAVCQGYVRRFVRGASGGKDRQSKRMIGAEVAQVAHLLTLDI